MYSLLEEKGVTKIQTLLELTKAHVYTIAPSDVMFGAVVSQSLCEQTGTHACH